MQILEHEKVISNLFSVGCIGKSKRPVHPVLQEIK